VRSLAAVDTRAGRLPMSSLPIPDDTDRGQLPLDRRNGPPDLPGDLLVREPFHLPDRQLTELAIIELCEQPGALVRDLGGELRRWPRARVRSERVGAPFGRGRVDGSPDVSLVAHLVPKLSLGLAVSDDEQYLQEVVAVFKPWEPAPAAPRQKLSNADRATSSSSAAARCVDRRRPRASAGWWSRSRGMLVSLFPRVGFIVTNLK